MIKGTVLFLLIRKSVLLRTVTSIEKWFTLHLFQQFTIQVRITNDIDFK